MKLLQVFLFLTFSFPYLFLFLGHVAMSGSMQDRVPWPGIEPMPPALEVQSLNHWTIREDHATSISVEWILEVALLFQRLCTF